MKKTTHTSQNSRTKKIACTVSAAALLLGVSSAATVGLHFQDNYCGAPAYSGFPITLTAFGVESNGWESLLEMDTGYSSCKLTNAPYGYTLDEIIDSTTSTNGLNPLPAGASLTVTWWGPTANFTPFAGYGFSPPNYNEPGGTTGANDVRTNAASGEEQVYASFIRDGVNFGPPGGADNDQPPYYVDITGLKSLFPSNFVVQLIASSDSMDTLTNALVIDVTDKLTNSVSYTNTPPVADVGDGTANGESWVRGAGGGLSTVSAPLNTDHMYITSVQPAHGGLKSAGTDFNHAGTISGFIMTDKPVVTMSPKTIPVAGPGDTLTLSAYAIGVPPLTSQWRWNGISIPGATNLSYGISNVSLSSGGNFDLVVSNSYGVVTSKVSTVSVDRLSQVPVSNLVFDSNPTNAQHDGVNMGATWAPSNSDGTITRTGVMSFNGAETNGITVPDSAALDSATGTIAFWMNAAINNNSSLGVSIFCRTGDTVADDFIIYQSTGAPGNLTVQSPGGALSISSVGVVANNKWHFVALSFDSTATGGGVLYIDGAVDSTNANSAAWSPNIGQPLEIGYSSDTSWTNYTGFLSDVRFYNTNLTSAQISSIYTTGGVGPAANLEMQLQFIGPPANGFTLTWKEGSAVLQSAPTLSGPWSDVNGAASPYTIVPTEAQQFFRYMYVPQTIKSNPYLM
jgi:hypothetical protein